MGFNISVDDVVVMAVLKGQENLSDIMAADRFTVDKARSGTFDNLKAEVSTSHKFEHHVEHSLRAGIIIKSRILSFE
jgi:hypothetical protein